MNASLDSGKYVIAVSGGVDSIVLIDILHKDSGLDLVIAHFDHGIRADSYKDRELVESLATKYGLKFMHDVAELPQDTSEAEARDARYKFLRGVMDETGARAIVTAHHEDDLLETAILNMLRGTGRKGLTSLSSNLKLQRPLLKVSKNEILNYAFEHNLKWNEDSTNSDTKYLRNYVRLNIVPKFSDDQKQAILKNIENLKLINDELDKGLLENITGGKLDRMSFSKMPHKLACEVMASWLRSLDIRDFDKKLIERLVVGAKVSSSGKSLDTLKNRSLLVGKKQLSITES